MKLVAQSELVSACGLYCGACHRYRKGKCPGCAENVKASWCKIRICTQEKGYHTCAECTEFSDDVQACRQFNTIFAKIFALIFRSDRKASLQLIAAKGVEAYALEMAEKGIPVLKRR
ncbi:MAG: hypothetical protein VR65_17720 [Desulfobulbaceae bacterium BRH_c16a]|nr:MAG: hypothetical protein VR65_17720 [Desulfobulbaceae bacterium BRH_c16a]